MNQVCQVASQVKQAGRQGKGKTYKAYKRKNVFNKSRNRVFRNSLHFKNGFIIPHPRQSLLRQELRGYLTKVSKQKRYKAKNI